MVCPGTRGPIQAEAALREQRRWAFSPGGRRHTSASRATAPASRGRPRGSRASPPGVSAAARPGSADRTPAHRNDPAPDGWPPLPAPAPDRAPGARRRAPTCGNEAVGHNVEAQSSAPGASEAPACCVQLMVFSRRAAQSHPCRCETHCQNHCASSPAHEAFSPGTNHERRADQTHSDASFDTDVLKSDKPGAGRLLGRWCGLQDDRPILDEVSRSLATAAGRR